MSGIGAIPKSSARNQSRFAGICRMSGQTEANRKEDGMVRATMIAPRQLPSAAAEKLQGE